MLSYAHLPRGKFCEHMLSISRLSIALEKREDVVPSAESFILASCHQSVLSVYLYAHTVETGSQQQAMG